jgi:hypothetical protein
LALFLKTLGSTEGFEESIGIVLISQTSKIWYLKIIKILSYFWRPGGPVLTGLIPSGSYGGKLI